MKKMKKTIIITILALTFIFILSTTASAVRFDVEQARQEEWERYEAYRTDYINFLDIVPFSDYVNEHNLMRNFGFYGPDHYYIPPNVWQAKYNPPVQGDVYYTANRGYGSALTHQPSSANYFNDFGEYRLSNLNGKYFDHPHIYGTPTGNYGVYENYGYGTRGSNYNYRPNYDYQEGYQVYGGYGTYGYMQGYNYNNYNDDKPAYYARIAEPYNNGFYLIGYY